MLVVIVCIRLAKAQIRQNSSMKRGVGHNVPSLVKKLLATVSCWERKGQLSLKFWAIKS